MAVQPRDASVSDLVAGGLVRAAPSLLVLAVLLGAWQSFAVVSPLPAVILPSPVQVGRAGVTMFPVLLADGAVTAFTALLGLVCGTVLGLVLAFAMTYSRTAAVVVHPYLIALRVAPMIAIAPLLFLWFGHGVPARVLLVSMLTVFPVAIASLDGLRSVPQEYLDVARSVAAPPWQVFLRVRVPAAAPSVFAGIKLAAALSVIGTVVAEFVTLNAGLGYRIFVASTYLRTARMFAALFALAALGLAFYLVPVLIERRLRWGERGR